MASLALSAGLGRLPGNGFWPTEISSAHPCPGRPICQGGPPHRKRLHSKRQTCPAQNRCNWVNMAAVLPANVVWFHSWSCSSDGKAKQSKFLGTAIQAELDERRRMQGARSDYELGSGDGPHSWSGRQKWMESLASGRRDGITRDCQKCNHGCVQSKDSVRVWKVLCRFALSLEMSFINTF